MVKEKKINTAIELLNDALLKIEGDNNKQNIAMVIQELLREEGREEEALQYNKYLPTGPSYEDDESI